MAGAGNGTGGAADGFAARCRALVGELGVAPPGAVVSVRPLSGGVASDIAALGLADGREICVKFALPQLRVAELWQVPVGRNAAEYAWLDFASRAAPGSAPRLFGRSAQAHGFAMELVSGPDVWLWKAALLSGAPDRGEAQAVGAALGRIHAASTAPGFDRAPFENRADFHAIRIEPYLRFTATRHPDLAAPLNALADALDAAGGRTGAVLVHGDVSPKNILFRDGRPLFLDAECASMGDAAFDLAFCLNHLLLKAVHMPACAPARHAAVRSLWAAYAPQVTWEAAAALEARVAALVPALMLARVDGKSPVEYLSPEAQARVRRIALPLIAAPPADLSALIAAQERA